MPATHVALLRGINVGGNNKVPMARLREVVESLDYRDVSTYIASGNLLFSHEQPSVAGLEAVIESEFGFRVPVLLRDREQFRHVLDALPPDWRNDETHKCDVLFLWDELGGVDIAEQLPVRDGIDEIRVTEGAVLWRAARKDRFRSGLMRLVGQPVYRKMTIRNCTTARKIGDLIALT